MKFNMILSCFVAILALVNPIQKVLIVSSLQERFSPAELRLSLIHISEPTRH